MKENSREEDIKMIEILKNKNLYINIKPKSSICIDCINKNKNKHIEAEVVINEKLEEAINYTLSDYKRVLKENEELKADNYELNNIINDLLDNIPTQKVKDILDKMDKINIQSKESVKLFEKMRRNTTDDFYRRSYQTSIHKLNAEIETREGIIDIFRELIESEE